MAYGEEGRVDNLKCGGSKVRNRPYWFDGRWLDVAEEIKAPIIRRIYETTAFDPERGTYRAVIIRVEWPKGNFHDITIPVDEYDPDKVMDYVKDWFEKYGRWLGMSA